MSATFYLNFHGIGEPHAGVDADEMPYWLSANRFRDILALPAVRVADVGITFDDGNLSDLREAAPLLMAAGLTAHFFIPTDRIGDPLYLGADDIRALVRQGMRIGSHGLGHTNWTALDDAALDAEIVRPLALLSEIVAAPVRAVGVPFGAYDARVLRALRRHGVERVFTSDGGPCRPGAWLAPRTSIRADMAVARIEAMLAQPRDAAAYYARAAKRVGRRVLRQFAG